MVGDAMSDRRSPFLLGVVFGVLAEQPDQRARDTARRVWDAVRREVYIDTAYLDGDGCGPGDACYILGLADEAGRMPGEPQYDGRSVDTLPGPVEDFVLTPCVNGLTVRGPLADGSGGITVHEDAEAPGAALWSAVLRLADALGVSLDDLREWTA